MKLLKKNVAMVGCEIVRVTGDGGVIVRVIGETRELILRPGDTLGVGHTVTYPALIAPLLKFSGGLVFSS